MPTFNVRDNTNVKYDSPQTLFPVIYNGKLYVIWHISPKTIICNVDDDIYTEITETEDPDALSLTTRLIDFKMVTKSTYILRCLHIRSGELVIDRLEIDLDTPTATRTEEKTFSLSWISTWGEMAHSVVIPPYLWLAPNEEDGYVHYVDLRDGSDISFDTGFGSYFARFSSKYIPYKDDIYMLFGRHLAGDPHYLLKLYSQTVTSLGITTGGGSPRPQIGNLSWFYDDIIIPTVNSGVVNVDNDIALLDESFNQIATIDVGALTGFTYNDLVTMGINIFAKKRDGSKYYTILGSENNTGFDATEGKIIYVELDNAFNVLSSQVLLDIDEHAGVGLGADYSDFYCRPILIVPRKKIYVLGRREISGKGFIIEIDVSDIWDDVEFNKNLWVLYGKNPTSLSLTVTPL